MTEIAPTVTETMYMRSEIQRRMNENVGLRINLRMMEMKQIVAPSIKDWENAVKQLRAQISANDEVIHIYTGWIEEAEKGNVPSGIVKT